MAAVPRIRFNYKKHIALFAILAIFVLALFYVLSSGLGSNPQKIPSALLNKPAPDFQVEWLQANTLIPHAGDKLTLSDLAGYPIILNFWASWCHSCIEEAGAFEQFWRLHQKNGLKVVGIAIQDTPERALSLASELGKSYILGLNANGSVAINYGVTGVPETFFINRAGIIVHKETGPIDLEILKRIYPNLL